MGDVRLVFIDLKLLTGSSIPKFKPDVRSVNNYYPFGMMMPFYCYQSTSFPKYRYGYNGMERDDEVKTSPAPSAKDGTGNSYDYGARFYDPRVGRWLSLDQYKEKYPDITPFGFSLNNPIKNYDDNGKIVKDQNGKIIVTFTGYDKVEFAQDVGRMARVGYILSDKGTRIPVVKATQDVFGGDNSYNCTGNCFGNQELTIFSDYITDEILQEEGYETMFVITNPGSMSGFLNDNVNITGKVGDIGEYQNSSGLNIHFERFLNDNKVSAKGGIQPPLNGFNENIKAAKSKEFIKGSTKDGRAKFYSILRKMQPDVQIVPGSTSLDNLKKNQIIFDIKSMLPETKGLREVNQKEMDEIEDIVTDKGKKE